MDSSVKVHLQSMETSCSDLIKYVDHVNSIGGITKLDDLYEHAICDCINRIGDGVKKPDLHFDDKIQKDWSGLRVITAHHYHKLDLSKVWKALPGEAKKLLAVVEERLK